MSAKVLRIENYRQSDEIEQAWERALRAFIFAQEKPSIRNMAVAVDAWRAWEKLFAGKVLT